MKKIMLVASLLMFLPATFAEENVDTSRFEFLHEIKIEGIVTPKIVRVEIPEEITGGTIVTDESGRALRHKILREREKLPIPSLSAESTSSAFEGNKNAITDGNATTHFAFASEGDLQKSIVFRFAEKTEISRIFIDLDSGVIPPRNISVAADFGNGKLQTILNNQHYSSSVQIPKITPTRLKISFETPHFLRLDDISFGLENSVKKPNAVIFFAEEGQSYQFFFGEHFGAKLPRTDAQHLETDKKTPNFVFGERKKNPDFNPDFDKDGIPDNTDLCPRDADPTNADKDGNGRGDFCEDPDLDGRVSARDNCPFASNPNQADVDQDGIGDKCDTEESRFSENHPEILWLAMIGIIVVLGGAMWRGAQKKS